MSAPTRVVVLGGGPDAERDVSLCSASAVADALRATGAFDVHLETIDRPGPDQARSWLGAIVFPALHGPFGEGGPMQDLLESLDVAYVGSPPSAARVCMDKLATKLVASRIGLPTPEAVLFDPRDHACAIPPPVVLKPVRDGSSIGVHLCPDADAFHTARHAVLADLARTPARVYMAERLIPGRELTVGVLDGSALPIIEIRPAAPFYDFDAKYNRDDTTYLIAPELPPGLDQALSAQAVALVSALGVRHLARVDFILDAAGVPWLLEVNTMPGFTPHSLVPMAARHVGLDLPALCALLVRCAARDHARRGSSASALRPHPRAQQSGHTGREAHAGAHHAAAELP